MHTQSNDSSQKRTAQAGRQAQATTSRPMRANAPQAAPSTELRSELPGLRPELYARALRMARSPARAEDIVQDTMVRALRFEAQYRPGTNLRAWVSQILRTVFLSQMRRNKRERRALDHLYQDPCAWVKSDSPSVMASLSPKPARALASLAQGYQDVVRLVDLQGLSYREAAEQLKVPVGTVMSRLHRGRRLLASLLAEPEPVAALAIAAA